LRLRKPGFLHKCQHNFFYPRHPIPMKKNNTSPSAFLLPRLGVACCLFSAAAGMSWIAFAGPRTEQTNSPDGRQSAAVSGEVDRTKMISQVSRVTGNNNFVKAPAGSVLVSADASATPESRALGFLATNGALVGLSNAEREALGAGNLPEAGSNLQIARSQTDALGQTHVRLDQFYRGLKVFGAQLVVHMSGDGITAVNGDFVSDLAMSTVPALNQETAGETALVTARKGAPDGNSLKVNKTELAIYPVGLLEGHPVESRLAYNVEIGGTRKPEQIWIDAQTGDVLMRVPLHHTALNRTVYSPTYDPANPALFVQRKEGDPPHPTPFVNNLYDFAGQTYNMYASGFGWDSYDNLGHKMISVYLITNACPNAYWNGESTNYCPAFDADDVVSHEWSHAYTQFTHGLIYAFQSGAMNEAYSDIFGEAVDLINGVDGIGGNNNAKPFPMGQRWLVGEDLGEEAQTLLLRDMYDPDRQGDPGKVSSPNYACGTDDGGGVHTNSGVPNHGFALTVDGTQFKPAVAEINQAAGTYNGQTITGIGLNKAAAIYFRAESVYQVPTSDFRAHDIALATSCSDLTGMPLKNLSTTSATGTISNEVITSSDCQQLAKAMLAVEMSMLPPCATGPLLSPDAAPVCAGSNAFFSEDWETGEDGWTKTSTGFGTGLVDWEDSSKAATRFFKVTSTLPGGRTGSAAFADDPKVGELGGGTCAPGGDYSGSHTLNSPAIVIPAGVTKPLLAFDHYIATEAGVDGAQVEISRNGGAFQLLPKSAYLFNAPNSAYNDTPPLGNNTGPNPNEIAWTGTNLGSAVLGSWGTTLVDLSSFAQPGDSIKIRYTWSQDGCNGVEGWYIDNIRVFTCPVFPAPVLSTGNDYENPDTNGSFTLNWTRPAGASGPDVLQVSQNSCTPLLSDNAEGTFGNWTTSSTGGGSQWKNDSSKPQHTSNTFNVQGTPGVLNADSYLTYKTPIKIPATGQTFLNFKDWDVNEGDDKVFVEVSENDGATWTAVYLHSRSEAGTGPVAFATEQLFQRSASLANQGGKTIRLRLRYSLGAEDRAASVPIGWYVDDINITVDDWVDAAVVSGTSSLQKKGSGTYCYRVNTAYQVGNETAVSAFSNVVNVTVVPGIVPVVSRKAHAGTHDIPLPLSGSPGIECRRGGGANFGSHQVVFQFAQPVTYTGASVTPGPGKTAEIDSVATNGNEVAVNLKNVSNAQTIMINLTGISGAGTSPNISVPMGILLGDVNSSRVVTGADVNLIRQQQSVPVTSGNFRTDINASGVITGADVNLTKQVQSSFLP